MYWDQMPWFWGVGMFLGMGLFVLFWVLVLAGLILLIRWLWVQARPTASPHYSRSVNNAPCGLRLRPARTRASAQDWPGLVLSKVREHRVETRQSARSALAGGYERRHRLRE